MSRAAGEDVGGGQEVLPGLARLGRSVSGVLAAARLDILMTSTQARVS